jgi:hypothetical protein
MQWAYLPQLVWYVTVYVVTSDETMVLMCAARILDVTEASVTDKIYFSRTYILVTYKMSPPQSILVELH